jgi:peptidoglycan/xylan/chitin deacetylase (PgdA/CDA1 family)
VTVKRASLNAAHRAGVLAALRRARGRHSLAVLCYHRIGYPERGPARFDPMCSATPEGFDAQLTWIAERYRVVSLEAVIEWARGRTDLPDRPLLITFDDGYRDNADVAAPILQSHRFPAALFLTTGMLDGNGPLWWDRVARCVERARAGEADLPLLGRVELLQGRRRRRTLAELIERLKELPEDDKLEVIASVAERLGVEEQESDVAELYIDWDTARRMQSSGFGFGAHTVTHPILTRIDEERVRHELVGSKQRIEAELGIPVRSLAYPNGQSADFDEHVKRAAAAAGFEVGFSLVPGPTGRAEVRADPLAVRRITIHHKDHPARFAAKLSGLPRLARLR